MTPRLTALGLVLTASLGLRAEQGAQRPTVPTTTVPAPAVPTPAAPQPARARSQPPPGSQAARTTSVVIGQIIDAASGRGVANAAVRMNGRSVAQTRLSDDKGRFYFKDLPAGDFTVTAIKAGFVDGAYGKRRAGGTGMPLALAPGQWATDVRIELFRHAAISGSVLDEGNEPVVGVRVLALRRQFVGGQWQFAPGGVETTDDQGSYRLYGLSPGDYVIVVPSVQVSMPMASLEAVASTGGAGGAMTALLAMNPMSQLERLNGLTVDDDDTHVLIAARLATPPPPAGKRHFSYPTQFYPAAELAMLAMPVALGSGDDHRGLSFQLRPVRTGRVEGHVIGADGPVAGQFLRLLHADGDDYGLGTEVAVTVSAPDGAFTFLRVPAGRYTVEARNPAGIGSIAPIPSSVFPADPDAAPTPRQLRWGRATTSMEGDDVSGVIVTMQEGLTINARVLFDGSSRRPAGDQLTQLAVNIEPANGTVARVPQTRFDSAGRLSIRGLLPGRYHLAVANTPVGWHLKSVSADGVDLSDAPLDATTDNSADVVLTFTDRPTFVIGTVRDARNAPAAGATVLVVPAAANGRGPGARRGRELRATSTGVFTIEGLPPGDYAVIALDDAAAEGWQDPQVLALLRTSATRLTLRDAEKRTLDLRLTPRR